MVDQVGAYVAKCPDSAVVMVGYSEGSQIIDDAFCGGPDGNSMAETAAPVPADVGARVKALVFMGDPRNIPGLPYNIGSSTGGGVSFLPPLFFVPLPCYVRDADGWMNSSSPNDLQTSRAPSIRTGLGRTATPRTRTAPMAIMCGITSST